MVVEPRETLYIRGIPDKVPTNEVRRTLYLYASQFGPILSVEYHKSPSFYGQAFIIFDSISSSTMALKDMKGRLFFQKEINASYAKRSGFAIDPAERRRRDLRRVRNAEKSVQ